MVGISRGLNKACQNYARHCYLLCLSSTFLPPSLSYFNGEHTHLNNREHIARPVVVWIRYEKGLWKSERVNQGLLGAGKSYGFCEKIIKYVTSWLRSMIEMEADGYESQI